MKYEPQPSYASKIDEERRFATAEEATQYDKERAIGACLGNVRARYFSAIDGGDAVNLRRAILYLADLIREGMRQPQSATHEEWEASSAAILQHCGDNAERWAEQFCLTAKRIGYGDIDREWMIGWFANAIEHSNDVRRWAREKAAAEKPEPATMEELFGDGAAPARPEPTQEDFFKAYEEALQDPRSYQRYLPAAAKATATEARSIISKNDDFHSWAMSDAMRTAWRAIGLDGEPTAEQIRALKETKP